MTLDIHASPGGETISLSRAFGRQACPHGLYQTVMLGADTLPLFLELQETAQAEGRATATTHHMKPRREMDLRRHIDAGMPLIGVHHAPSGRHVAQVLVADPFNAAAQYANGYPLSPGALLVQSFYIHPDHRFSTLRADTGASGPADLIFAGVKEHAAKVGADHLVAKISEDNFRSIRSFRRHGFDQVLATGVDPVHGHAVRYVAASVAPSMGIQPVMSGDRMEQTCPK